VFSSLTIGAIKSKRGGLAIVEEYGGREKQYGDFGIPKREIRPMPKIPRAFLQNMQFLAKATC
jgi:hypothetical protein